MLLSWRHTAHVRMACLAPALLCGFVHGGADGPYRALVLVGSPWGSASFLLGVIDGIFPCWGLAGFGSRHHDDRSS